MTTFWFQVSHGLRPFCRSFFLLPPFLYSPPHCFWTGVMDGWVWIHSFNIDNDRPWAGSFKLEEKLVFFCSSLDFSRSYSKNLTRSAVTLYNLMLTNLRLNNNSRLSDDIAIGAAETLKNRLQKRTKWRNRMLELVMERRSEVLENVSKPCQQSGSTVSITNLASLFMKVKSPASVCLRSVRSTRPGNTKTDLLPW